MKKSNHTYIIIIYITLTTSIQSCYRHPNELCGKSKLTFSETYRFNEIGILGPTETAPYIEVQYTISNGSGGNKIETIWVNPPCLIGGYEVNSLYDSSYICADGQVNAILKFVNVNFKEGGAEYMKIINHSSNTLEYFIAGTQDTSTISVKEFNINIPNNVTPPSIRNIITAPFVQYNNAPIYYLLHPDRKPNANLYSLIINNNNTYTGKYNTLTSQANPNQIGDMQVFKAWSISDIMNLYRAEYKQSKDTILTLCFDDFGIYPAGEPLINKRLSNGISSIGLKGVSKYFQIEPKQEKFYGYIPAYGSLQSNDSIPLITHFVWGNTWVK